MRCQDTHLFHTIFQVLKILIKTERCFLFAVKAGKQIVQQSTSWRTCYFIDINEFPMLSF